MSDVPPQAAAATAATTTPLNMEVMVPPDQTGGSHRLVRLIIIAARPDTAHRAKAGAHSPPPPPGVAPPPAWGEPAVVSERLGAAVRDIRFDRDVMVVPSLSPQHNREMTERTAGPVMKLVETLRTFDPGKLAAFRREFEALAVVLVDNTMRQGYLMTRATKV